MIDDYGDARKADTATEWLEDVNASPDTVIEVIDVKPFHPKPADPTKLIREFGSGKHGGYCWGTHRARGVIVNLLAHVGGGLSAPPMRGWVVSSVTAGPGRAAAGARPDLPH
jgi:hypothetical protein